MTTDYTERSISEELDALIEAQATLQSEQRTRSNTTRPQPPDTFEGAKALADYNHRKAMWEHTQLAADEADHRRTDRFEKAVERVKAILPLGTSVTHTYQGRQYQISHHALGGIQIEERGI
jgi:hypothetical protein